MEQNPILEKKNDLAEELKPVVEEKIPEVKEPKPVIEGRKEKVKNWLKNPQNLTFLAIIIFATVIRLYYFSLTKSQPLWWDESDYLAYAKNLAGFNVDWIVTAKHNSLFPFLVAALFKIGFSEVATKFILEFIPSIALVFLTYITLNAMYEDKRIALVSSFLMAVLWPVLFNSMRFHLGVPALVFGFLAIYTFWQGFEKKKKIFWKIHHKWALPIAVFFVILTYSIRRGYFLFGIFFLIYILATRNWRGLIKDKYNWLALAVAAVFLFFTEKLIFTSQAAELTQGYFHIENPISFLPFKVFSSYFANLSSPTLSILLYLFWIGLFILVVRVILSIDQIRNVEKRTTRSDLFHLITIIVTLGFFIFILRSQTSFGEPRWYFPMLLGTLVAISRSSLFLLDYLRKYNKQIVLFIFILLIGFGGYYQLQHSSQIIEVKIDSFQGIKDAGLLLRDISEPNDLIIVAPQPQMAYYSERNVIHPKRFINWEGDKEDVPQDELFDKIRETPEAKYLVVSFSEQGHPSWMKRVQYTQNGQMAAWEIPFMDTKIDFVNNVQEIRQSKTFGDLTFNLLDVKQDVFIYEIVL